MTPLVRVLLATLAVLVAVSLASAPRAASAPVPPRGETWLTPGEVARLGLRMEPAEEHELMPTPNPAARADEGSVRVYAPAGGRVVRLVVAPGDRVKAGAPLALVAVPDTAWVVYCRAETRLAVDPAAYSRCLPPPSHDVVRAPIDGEVLARVGPTADAPADGAPAELLTLRSLERATPRLGALRVLAVPPSALVHAGDTTLVYVLRGMTSDGRVALAPQRVTVDGRASAIAAGWVPLASGLAAGETIAAPAAPLLLGAP
jgi:pyruvate/2-oxoglutarate dehydrogenase complex dihydrolipoamide acyltransferase (E2) component